MANPWQDINITLCKALLKLHEDPIVHCLINPSAAAERTDGTLTHKTARRYLNLVAGLQRRWTAPFA
jgi:hypothetical protein